MEREDLYRKDLPLYLYYETEPQVVRRLINDKVELSYCLILWNYEAITRCEPYIQDRNIFRKLVDGRISFHETKASGKLDIYGHLNFCVRNFQEEGLAAIKSNEDYFDVLAIYNCIFQKLTICLTRIGSMNGLSLPRLWDFYLRTVELGESLWDFESNVPYTVGEYGNCESEEEFNDLNTRDHLMRAMIELDMLVAKVNPDLLVWGEPYFNSTEGLVIQKDEYPDCSIKVPQEFCDSNSKPIGPLRGNGNDLGKAITGGDRRTLKTHFEGKAIFIRKRAAHHLEVFFTSIDEYERSKQSLDEIITKKRQRKRHKTTEPDMDE